MATLLTIRALEVTSNYDFIGQNVYFDLYANETLIDSK